MGFGRVDRIAHTVRESRAVISGTIDVPTRLPLALGAAWGIEPLPTLVFGPTSSVRQNALRYCGARTYGIVRTLADASEQSIGDIQNCWAVARSAADSRLASKGQGAPNQNTASGKLRDVI